MQKYNFQITVRSARPSIIREFANETASYTDAVNLTLGQPDFHTPQRIKDAAIRAINDNKTVYTNNDGIKELRVEACRYFKRHYQLEYDPEWEMMITHGATEALDAAMRTMLSNGDEVIVPAPVYPGYESLIRFCGAVPIFVDTSSNHFVINRAMLDKVFTSYTRCLLMPYPCNPTGAVPTQKDLEEIAGWLDDHPDVCVISDEVYAGLTFEGRHRSIASFGKGIWERSIIVNGVSKSHAMTGWRIGFLAAPTRISDELYKVHQSIITCASSVSQYAALEALKDDSDTEYMCGIYKKRCDYLTAELKKLGFAVEKPKGAFYLFPSIRQFNMSSEEFSTRLLREYHVGTVPGNAFSNFGESYIRISFASSMEQLHEFIERLKTFIGGL